MPLTLILNQNVLYEPHYYVQLPLVCQIFAHYQAKVNILKYIIYVLSYYLPFLNLDLSHYENQ